MSIHDSRRTIQQLWYCGYESTTPTYRNVVIGKYGVGGNDPERKIPQAYNMSEYSTFSGFCTYKNPPNATYYRKGASSACFGPPSYTLEIPSDLNQRLINRLAGQVRGHDFNIGISSAEAKESLGMIRDRSKKISKSLNDMQNAQKLKRAAKKFIPAAAWLEAVYGWLPLMSDVKAGAEALAFNLNKPRKHTYRASIKVDGKARPANDIVTTASGRVRHSLRAQITLEEDPSLVANLQLDNPALVAWELVPYSFVADWFLPIGGWLEARSFLAQTKRGSCITTTLRVYDVRTDELIHPSYVASVFVGGSERGVQFSRVLSAPYLPVPKFRNLKDVFSDWRHTIDALALLNQRFRDTLVYVK